MTEDNAINSSSEPIAVEQASRMLRLGIHGPARPVDNLLDRLAEPDGATWLRGVLAMEGVAALATIPTPTGKESLVVGELTQIKESSKAAAIRGGSHVALLKAMVGYFFAIAGAFALFQTNISSRSSAELEPILIDLASVAPPDWSVVFERAWSQIANPA
jgi:hypothetical protein